MASLASKEYVFSFFILIQKILNIITILCYINQDPLILHDDVTYYKMWSYTFARYVLPYCFAVKSPKLPLTSLDDLS